MVGKHEQYISHPVEPTASGILGYWILVIPSGSHGGWCIASTPENAARRTCVGQSGMGAERRKREGENDTAKEVEKRDDGAGRSRSRARMKIFLGMPKTETRAGRSSLPPRPREGTPAVLCVTSEIAVISRWPPLVPSFLSFIYFLRRFILFLSPFAHSRARGYGELLYLARVYMAYSDNTSLSSFKKSDACVPSIIDQSAEKRNFAIDYRSISVAVAGIRPWRWISWEPVGISGSFVRLLRSTSTLWDTVGEAPFENPCILKES